MVRGCHGKVAGPGERGGVAALTGTLGWLWWSEHQRVNELEEMVAAHEASMDIRVDEAEQRLVAVVEEQVSGIEDVVLDLVSQVRQQDVGGVQRDELADLGRQHGVLADSLGQPALVDRVSDLEEETGLVYSSGQSNLPARIDRLNTCLTDVLENPGTATGLRPNAYRMISSRLN